MKRTLQRIMSWLVSSAGVPWLLLGVCLAAYGLLIPWLGIYVDDWTFLWTSLALGRPGEEVYFTIGNDRPFWGIFYHFFVPLIGAHPWAWHLFGIFWLWLTALCVWWIVRQVWPGKPRAALWSGLFFALYPGFRVQWASLVVGHMWLVYAAALGSIGFSLAALRRPKRWLMYSVLGVLLSAVNLLSLEYFVMLELARPLLMAVVLRGQGWKKTLAKTIKAWLPYLLLLIGVLVWRMFFFPLQQHKYQLSLLTELRADPLGAVWQLLVTVVKDIFWNSSLLAWGQALTAPLHVNLRDMGGLASLGLALVSVLLLWTMLRRAESLNEENRGGLEMAALGLAAMLLAGWPFWLTGLQVKPVLMNSRFTMPFMFGLALLLAGLFSLLRWQRVRPVMLALLFGLAIAWQFQTADDFRQAWVLHARAFWQLSWRVPSLQPGTAIFSNDWPFRYFSDNTDSAELNLLINLQNPSARIEHVKLSYRETRIRTGQELAPGQDFWRNLMSARFYGSTARAVVLYYDQAACLRRLDAELDAVNPQLPDEMRTAAVLSNPAMIVPAGQGNDLVLPADIYGAEPPHTWCYFQNKADWAASQADWQTAAELGDLALAQAPLPRQDAMLGAVFVEAFAHLGRWPDALKLSQQISQAAGGMRPGLCRLWQRIDRSAPETAGKRQALQQAYGQYGCR